jgi:hypothetical protein
MVTIPYTNSSPVVHLTGTPHCHGAKAAVNQIRNGLRRLTNALHTSGWIDDHAVASGDQVSMDLIVMNELGPAERHSLRIAAAVLVRVARTNGYHV